MGTITIKLHKTDSDFLDKVATCLYDDRGNWYYMPFWFHKTGEGLYEEYRFEDLPEWVKDRIKKEIEPIK